MNDVTEFLKVTYTINTTQLRQDIHVFSPIVINDAIFPKMTYTKNFHSTKIGFQRFLLELLLMMEYLLR